MKEATCRAAWYGAAVLAAGMTLAPARPAAAEAGTAPERTETVFTAMGDQFTGTILGTVEGKWLRIQGRQFKEPAKIDLSLVTRIEFNAKLPTPKGTRIALTNGDYVLGELKGLTAEKADLVTCSGVPMSLPVADLLAVTTGNTRPGSVESTFETNDMSPWTAIRGKWKLSDGRVTTDAVGAVPGDGVMLAAPFPQNGPATFVGDFEPGPDSNGQTNFTCGVLICASNLKEREKRSGVLLQFNGWGCDVLVARAGGIREPVANWPLQEHTARVRLRLAYDPDAGEGRVWVNDRGNGEPFTANGPKDGTHVAVVSLEPLAARRLAVIPGIVGPGEEPVTAPEEGVRVSLANGDSLVARSVALADGHLTVRTEFGDLTPELGNVPEIRYFHKARPAPPPANFVRVQAADCLLTFDSCEIFEDRLVGRSALYGTLTLKRNSLCSIKFEHWEKPGFPPHAGRE